MPAIGDRQARRVKTGRPRGGKPAAPKPVSAPVAAAVAPRIAAPAPRPTAPKPAKAPKVVKKPTAPKKPSGPSLEERMKTDVGLRRRVLANPGLRAKVSDKWLTKEQRTQRRVNTRLRAPIVAGSTTTEGDLAREAQAAMAVKFGPLEREQQQTVGEEQARARDVGGPGGFYDQYLKQVAQHAQNVQGIGAAAAQTGLGTQQGITGLANTDLTQLNQRATADAQARGATSGDIAQMASNAAAIRQGLVGSFIAQQAGQNAASSNYADTLANVVAPGQKLGAQAMAAGQVRKAQDKVTGTIADKAAEDYVYRAGRRSEEAKNVLAREIATGKATGEAADIESKRTTTAKTQAELDYFKKHGYYPSTGKPKTTTPSTTGYGAGKTGMNKYGYTYDEWTKLPKAEQDKWRSGKNKPGSKGKPGKGKPLTPQKQYEQDFFTKYGIKPATTPMVNKAKSEIGNAKVWLGTLTGGENKMSAGAAGKILTTGQPAKGKDSVPVPKIDPVLIRVAMDLKKHPGYIDPATADRLHRAGYSVPGLGLTTRKPTYNERIRSGQAKGPLAPGRR